jgi:hypothetical protein
MPWPALIGAALLPYIAFKAGSFLAGWLSGWQDRQEVPQRLKRLGEDEQKPLNQRIRGYDLPEAGRFWEVLKGTLATDRDLLPSEERSLRLDLFFPLLYGAAFAVGLLIVWRNWSPSFAFPWLLLPVAVYILADWTENLTQLKQLRLYRTTGPAALQASAIQVASRATTVKLLFFIGSHLLLLSLVLLVLLK